jgi:hypothetical protein
MGSENEADLLRKKGRVSFIELLMVVDRGRNRVMVYKGRLARSEAISALNEEGLPSVKDKCKYILSSPILVLGHQQLAQKHYRARSQRRALLLNS